MAASHVPGFTSTGSKRPEALFGPRSDGLGLPTRVARAAGCRVWDPAGREYIDYVMALGAVALGYGHPVVNRAAISAIDDGVVGPLAPVLEEELAAALCRAIPWIEAVRFLKTGAEAVAAAVRLGRVATQRDHVLACGYHGWLDWCQGGAAQGVPAATRALCAELPFNDVDRTRALIRAQGPDLAAVVVEPLVVEEPRRAWLEVLREETRRVGAVLVFDEIKTGFRLAVGGAAERYGVHPDLMVLGKAMANGFPLAAVGGERGLMNGVSRTWISSTLATEAVALAAARATVDIMTGERVCEVLHERGRRLLLGLGELTTRHPDLVTGVGGVAEMCFLHYATDEVSQAVARGCARRGLLFKRTAYNFVSLAHDDAVIDQTLATLDEVLGEVDALGRAPGPSS